MPTDTITGYDVVVAGCGAAGLAAAVTAAETRDGLRVAVLERADRLHRGGSTRWTGAYMRLSDPYTVAPDFVEDMLDFSGGRSDPRYVRALVDFVPETMEWVQEKGLRFRPQPTIFITRSRPRLLPEGGGERIVTTLAARAEALGVDFWYETTAIAIAEEEHGKVSGVRIRRRDGTAALLGCRALVIATGGFEGNPEMLVQYLGRDADQLRNISEGGAFNRGEGIRMALAVGGKPAGEYGGFHAEPIDPRSENPEPVVMVFPYGILVNSRGERFVDEAAATADETYEHVAREIWNQPGHVAFFVGDQRLTQVPGRDHAVLTEKPAITADTVNALAERLSVPSDVLTKTVQAFNAATSEGTFRPAQLDGHATAGLSLPKSNWAYPLDTPPYVAYPMSCSIVFTYGGIGTNTDAQVVTTDDAPIPGLYAAGECTGLYYGKYPGATSVLRSLVFGRVAGRNAAAHATAASS